LHQLAQLPSANAHVPAIEQRQYERVSDQVAKRQRAIVAVDRTRSEITRTASNTFACGASFQRAGYLFVKGMGGG
jgi:hypothetical protein